MQTRARAAQEALDANSRLATATIDALRAAGVAEPDLRTSQLSVSPTQDPTTGRVTGYEVSNLLTATLRDVGRAGAVIDAAGAAAGDAIRVQQLEFSVADDGAPRPRPGPTRCARPRSRPGSWPRRPGWRSARSARSPSRPPSRRTRTSATPRGGAGRRPDPARHPGAAGRRGDRLRDPLAAGSGQARSPHRRGAATIWAFSARIPAAPRRCAPNCGLRHAGARCRPHPGEDRGCRCRRARRWAWLVGLTAMVTAGLAALGLPSPALFGGLLVATVLALAGRAPDRVPGAASTAAMAVIGVVIGVIGQPSTLAALAGDTGPVLLVGLATLVISMAGRAADGAAPRRVGADRDARPHRGRRVRADRDHPRAGRRRAGGGGRAVPAGRGGHRDHAGGRRDAVRGDGRRRRPRRRRAAAAPWFVDVGFLLVDRRPPGSGWPGWPGCRPVGCSGR